MLFLAAILACDPAPAPTASPTPNPAAAPAAAAAAVQEASIAGVVEENLAAGSYTYTRAKPASGESVWVAHTDPPPAVGSTVTIATHLPMRDFHSESLKRDFALVYFVESLTGGAAEAEGALPAGHPSVAAEHGAPAAATNVPAVLGPPAGSRSVEQVWAERATLNGREVSVRGKVVKVTEGVLGRNWLHLRDGTGAEGTNDLTVTTSGTVAVGDEVVAKGIVSIDQDFGAGYVYPVIVTGASLD